MNDEVLRKLRDVTKRLIQAKGREPTIEEISEAAQVPVEVVRRVVRIERLSPLLDDPNQRGA